MDVRLAESVRGLPGSLAALSAGAAAIHFAMVPSHLEHHWTMGVGFLLAGWAQLAWAAAVLVAPSRRLLLIGGLLSAALIMAYGVVHTAGWPWGNAAGEAEELTAPGILCVAFEGLLAIGALLALQGGRARRVARTAFALPVIGTLVVAMSSATLAVTADDEHSADSEPAHASATPGADDATAAQRLAAERLAEATRGAVAGLGTIESAQAAGYRLLSQSEEFLLHYGNPAYITDDRVLDPGKVEGLIYVRLADGSSLLIGAMYMAEEGKGPDIGGPITTWEEHADLCLDDKGRIAPVQPDGRCLPGTTRGTSGELLHTWTIDYPGGPFAPLEIDALRTAVEGALAGGTPTPGHE